MPKLTKQQIIIIGGVLVALALVFILIFVGKKPSPGTTVNLSVWGTDSSNLFNEKIITKYTALRPNVKIAYTEVPQANYDAAVVSALAAGNGPDVFLIGNHDLASKQALLSPVDPVQYPFANISQLFPDVVGDDFVSGGALYALPLYMDTMALLYNKDVFNQAGIPVPPVTWKDFQNDIPLLRSLGSSGQIVKAAAAIGGSEATVNHAVDLLHLLMLQNGAQMTLPNFSKATFAEGSGGHAPGLGAFQFYLQFANAASSAYTWNENQPQSLQSFGGGETAMLLDYHDAFVSLKKQNPFLNIGIAPMLQISSSSATNYASYEGLAVSKQSKNAAWAWDFITLTTTNADIMKGYLSATGNPPALRSMIADDLNDAEYSVFAKQALTAKSWHVPNYASTRTIFNTAIQNVLSGRTDAVTALEQSQAQVTQLLQQ